MAETWNATFDVKPQGTDTVGTMDNFIVATRQAVRERVAKEHLFDFAANSQQGLHKMGSARVWTAEEGSEPVSPIPTGTTTETAGNEGEGRLLMIVDSSGNPTGVLKQWVGTVAAGAWVVIGTNAATANTLVARDASGDFSANMITSDLTGDVTGNADTATAAVDADTVDTYHAGNETGKVPISNTTVNTDLNADMLDGSHLSELVLKTFFSAGVAGGYNTQSITSGGNWVIPAGLYMISAKDGFKLEIYSGSAWTLDYESSRCGGLVLSDGTNFRIEADGVSGSVYYRKLL